MTTLHILNGKGKAALVSDGDAVIFIENAVYQPTIALGASAYFALTPDCQARAVQMPDQIKAIDYNAFVELCTQYDKVVTW